MEAGRPTLIAYGLGSQTVQKGGGTGTRLVSLCFLDADATWPVHSHPRCQAFPTTVGGTLWDLSRRKLLHPEAAFCRALCHSSSSGCIPRRVCCALLPAAALASTSCGAEAAWRASPAAKQAMHHTLCPQRREPNLVFFLPCPLSCISF